MASTCCKAAQVLHAAGLVYRDFKMENTVQLQPGSYMVIDLEAVSKAGADLPAGFGLRSWSHDTLTDERYTTSSDMHMIGCLTDTMLQGGPRPLRSIEPSDEARDFVDQLEGKQLSAEDAL